MSTEIQTIKNNLYQEKGRIVKRLEHIQLRKPQLSEAYYKLEAEEKTLLAMLYKLGGMDQ